MARSVMLAGVKYGLWIVMVIAACGGGSQSTAATTPPPAQPQAAASQPLEAELTPAPDDALAAMTSFADQMCACHDQPCAEQVNDRMMAWGQQMAKQVDQAHATTQDEARRIAAIAERFSRCLTAIAQGAPATP
jgi:hypothetical protein